MGDVAGIYDGVHQTPDYQTNGIMFLSVENIATLKSEKYISEEAFKRDYKVYPQKGDILMTRIGDVGTTNVVESTELVAFYVSLALLKPIGIDSYFLSNVMKSPLFQKGLRERTLLTAIPQKINKDEIGRVDVFLPKKIKKQTQIGVFFKGLDHLITLHQRNLQLLKQLKQAYLQHMFPKNDEKVPQLRFANFSKEWEERKLGDIADKVTEKNGGLQYIETFTNSAEFGIISQRDFFDHDIAKIGNLDGYYIVRNKDFVYNPRISTSAPVGPINRNKLGRSGVMSPLYTVFRPHDVDTTYLEYFFKSKYWHSFMNFNGDSGARSDRFSIKDAVFFGMSIPIPHIEEQRKIGECLTQFDHLIILKQNKLTNLKQLKTAYLKRMFI